MSQDQDNVSSGHVYDGIQEYDNPLPGWWSWFFILSVVFSIFYTIYYHCGEPGRSVSENYMEDLAANLKLQFAEIGELQPDKVTLMKYKDDARWIKVGEATFKLHCISCHGEGAKGGSGPNLCDDHWKNVKSITDIPQVVLNGANMNAMPAWKTRLHPNEVVLVSAYLASLRGSVKAGEGKAPEGNPIQPW